MFGNEKGSSYFHCTEELCVIQSDLSAYVLVQALPLKMLQIEECSGFANGEFVGH